MHKNLILALIGIVSSFSLIAQRDSTINMESQFEGELRLFLRDANKLSTTPLIKEQVVEMTEIRYSTLPTRKTFTIEPKPILAAKINVEEKLPRLYRGYIRAGVGTYGTFPVDLYYTDGRSKKGTFGVHYHFLRSAGLTQNDQDSIPDSFSDNRLELWGKKFFKKTSLDAAFDWERNVTHWFSFDNETYRGNDVILDSLRQRVNTFTGKIGFGTFQRDSSEYNYRSDLVVRGTSDLYTGRETNVDWSATVSKLMNSELINGELGVNYNNFQFNGPNLGKFGVPLQDEGEVRNRQSDNAVIRFIPTVNTVKGNLRAKVGLGIFLEARSDNPFHAYPMVEASYNLLDGLLVPYAGLRGSTEPTTYLSLYRENPFITTFPDLKNRNNKLEAYGGVGGAISKSVSFSAGVNYFDWVNFAYFVADSLFTSDSSQAVLRSVGNKFTVVYDDLQAWNVHGELAINKGGQWNVNLRGDYFRYTVGDEARPWHQPGLKFTASGQYNLKEKLMIGLDVFYIGARWAKSFAPIEGQEMQADGSYHLRLNGFTDVNLKVNYRYNKRISAWVQFNNALGLRYQRWGTYEVQRFLGTMGFSYAF